METKLLIGNIINQGIKEKGIAKGVLAKRIGVSPSAISKWIKGEASPTLENLVQLCSVIDIADRVFEGLQLNTKKEKTLQEEFTDLKLKINEIEKKLFSQS